MMEQVGVESGDACRRAIQLPWETVNRFHDIDDGFGTNSMLDLGALTGRQRNGRPSSPAGVDEKSGLTRRGIVYEYIRSHPGAHVRGIANDLGLATGGLQYHLSWLERHGYIDTRKNGFYSFVYASKMFEERQEVVLGILSMKTSREILLSLLENAGVTQGELSKTLGYSQPTISWHMERLVRQGVVSKRRTGKGIAYEVLVDHGELLRFVKEYHPAVWRRWARRLHAVTLSAGDRNAEGGKIRRVGLMRPALVELIGRS